VWEHFRFPTRDIEPNKKNSVVSCKLRESVLNSVAIQQTYKFTFVILILEFTALYCRLQVISTNLLIAIYMAIIYRDIIVILLIYQSQCNTPIFYYEVYVFLYE